MILYTDHDSFCCDVLRELVRVGMIPAGDVLQADITKLDPKEISKYETQHHFAGCGGWPLALRLAGWPDDRPIWTGSCPCPSFSSAGKGEGFADPRGKLWEDFYRLIRFCKPAIVIGEQVDGAIRHGWLDRVFTDLEAVGYACGAVVLPACAVGAPQLRKRLFFVAHYIGSGCEGENRTGQPVRIVEVGTRPINTGGGGGGGAVAESECDGGWINEPGRGQEGRAVDKRNGGVGDGGIARSQGHRPELPRRSSDQLPTQHGFWSDSVPLLCKDGKYRRIPASVERLFQLVVDGFPGGNRSFDDAIDPVQEAAFGFTIARKIPNRAQMLRCAGNAIVPPLAAKFIRVVMEILGL